MFPGEPQRSVRTLKMQVLGPPVGAFSLDVCDPAGSRMDAVTLDVGPLAEDVMRRKLPPLTIEVETPPYRAHEQPRRAGDVDEIVPASAGKRDLERAFER